jgi:hypothetical protein
MYNPQLWQLFFIPVKEWCRTFIIYMNAPNPSFDVRNIDRAHFHDARIHFTLHSHANGTHTFVKFVSIYAVDDSSIFPFRR